MKCPECREGEFEMVSQVSRPWTHGRPKTWGIFECQNEECKHKERIG